MHSRRASRAASKHHTEKRRATGYAKVADTDDQGNRKPGANPAARLGHADHSRAATVDRRKSRVGGAGFVYLKSVLGDEVDDAVDLSAIVKPAIALFLERLSKVSKQIRKVLLGEDLDSEDEGMDYVDGYDEEDIDWMDEDEVETIEDAFEDFKHVVTNDSHKFATLASLVATTSFSMTDKRLDSLLGDKMPLRLRRVVILELSRTVSELWEKFRRLLLHRFKSFEKAFKWLDEDESGTMDAQEFCDAYVELKLDELASNEQKECVQNSTRFESPKSKDAKKALSKMEKENVRRRLNTTILKAEAKFLFTMLQIHQRGNWRIEEAEGVDDDSGQISMQHLVMVLSGVGEVALSNLREWIIRKYLTLASAFAIFGKADKAELSLDEFCELVLSVYSSSEAQLQFRRVGLLSSYKNDKSTNELRDYAVHVFNSIDVDGSGSMHITEMTRSLAEFGHTIPYALFRRRTLLQYGSHDAYFTRYKEEYETSDSLAFELDMTSGDLQRYSPILQKMKVAEAAHAILHSDGREASTDHNTAIWGDKGFTVEEFAICMFLTKSEDVTLEEHVTKRWPIDRDKGITFKEFYEKLVLQKTANVAPKSMIKRVNNMTMMSTPHLSRSDTRKSCQTESPQLSGDKVYRFGASVQDIRSMFEDIERKHRRVSLNILFQETTNVSDVLAIDRCSYQSGDRIVCRIRLSAEAQKRCKERPVVCVVSSRLEWKEAAGKGHWMLDGEKILDFPHLCDSMQELPRGQGGVVPREMFVRILVPFTFEETHELRLISSSNGREPGKQVGRAVPFSILQPAPEPPVVDNITPDLERGEASVGLNWSPPMISNSETQVKSYIIHVEPIIYSHNILVEAPGRISGPVDPKGHEQFKEVLVWSPSIKRFSKMLSYDLHGLHKGVQYRFGVQCVHPVRSGGTSVGPAVELRGARSDLCDAVTMPQFSITSAPGTPEATLEDEYVQLVWTVPNEGLWDLNRICSYSVQFREVYDDECQEESSASSGESSSSASKHDQEDQSEGEELGESIGDGESERGSGSSSESSSGSSSSSGASSGGATEGWMDVDSSCLYIAPPQWVDYLGWQGQCHIFDLEALTNRNKLPRTSTGTGAFTDDGSNSRIYEFRLSAVNYAGQSPWSNPSSPVKLDAGEQYRGSIIEPELLGLEVLDVRRAQDVEGENSNQQCSMAIVRWKKPLGFDKTFCYTASLRDAAHARGHGGWSKAELYLLADKEVERRSVLAPFAEAIVLGLDKFPSFASLSLQISASWKHGSCSAQAEIEGIGTTVVRGREDAKAPLPVPGMPRVHQIYFGSLAGPPLLELEWDMDGSPVDDDERNGLSFELLVAEATKPVKAGAKQLWGDFEPIADAFFIPTQDNTGAVRCLARQVISDNAVGFCVRVRDLEGRLGDVSQVCAVQPEVSKKRRDSLTQNDVAAPARAAAATNSKPKKPRNLSVTHYEETWCELAWEQRVQAAQMPPTKFEVEQSLDELGVDSWRPVEKTYVSLGDVDEETGAITVRAIVFFANEHESTDAPGVAQAASPAQQRYRLRVRAAGAEWSSSTAVSNEAAHPMLQQPPAPSITRTDQQYISLEWAASQSYRTNGGVFELQVQARQQKTGKLSDWTSLNFFLRHEACADGDSSLGNVVTALVDKRDTFKTLKTGGYDAVRFRVRVVVLSGASGLPSEASALVPLATSLPPPPAPLEPVVVGSGHILMDSEDDELVNAQFVRLHWELPSVDVEDSGDGSSFSFLPKPTYKIEMEDTDNLGSWRQADGALVDINQDNESASAVVVMPPSAIGRARSTRYRIIASRSVQVGSAYTFSAVAGGTLVADAPQTCSLPSPVVRWADVLEHRSPPVILQAKPDIITVSFCLSTPSSYAALRTPMAIVEVRKARAAPDSEDEEDSDDIEDEDDFSYVGEFPVHWKFGVDNFMTGRASICGEAFGNTSFGSESIRSVAKDHHLDQSSNVGRTRSSSETAGYPNSCILEGVIMRGDSEIFCDSGSEVRVRLCLRKESEASLMFNRKARASTSKPHTCQTDRVSAAPSESMLLYYPEWPQALKNSTDCRLEPKAMLGKSGTWREQALVDSNGVSRARFRLLLGNLPKGLSLDEATGVLAGTTDCTEDAGHMFALEALPLEESSGNDVSRAAVVLHTMCRSRTRDNDSEEWAYLEDAASEFPDFLDACMCIYHAVKGDAGTYAIELVQKIMQLPSDAVVVAADMPVEQLLVQLCEQDLESENRIDDDWASDEEMLSQLMDEDLAGDADLDVYGIDTGEIRRATVAIADNEHENWQVVRKATLANDGCSDDDSDDSDTREACKSTVSHARSSKSAVQSRACSPRLEVTDGRKSVGPEMKKSSLRRQSEAVSNYRRRTLQEHAKQIKRANRHGSGHFEDELSSDSDLQSDPEVSDLAVPSDPGLSPRRSIDCIAPRKSIVEGHHLPRKSVVEGHHLPRKSIAEPQSPRKSVEGHPPRKSTIAQRKKSRPPSPAEGTPRHRKSGLGEVSLGFERKVSKTPAPVRPGVQIAYSDMTPFWAAFTDVNFIPRLKVAEEEVTASPALGLSFSISPPLRPPVHFDGTTGAISGSPLSEQKGCQYTITASWSDGAIAATCALAFAVLPPEMAALCNRAYQGYVGPSFTLASERGKTLSCTADAANASEAADSPKADLSSESGYSLSPLARGGSAFAAKISSHPVLSPPRSAFVLQQPRKEFVEGLPWRFAKEKRLPPVTAVATPRKLLPREAMLRHVDDEMAAMPRTPRTRILSRDARESLYY